MHNFKLTAATQAKISFLSYLSLFSIYSRFSDSRPLTSATVTLTLTVTVTFLSDMATPPGPLPPLSTDPIDNGSGVTFHCVARLTPHMAGQRLLVTFPLTHYAYTRESLSWACVLHCIQVIISILAFSR